jgi:hypothetical protein
MKKLFTILFVGTCLFAAHQSNAQLIKKGIKGGVNFSSIKNFGDAVSAQSTSSYTGWHAGVFLQAKLPIVAIQLDILYQQQGQVWTDLSSIDENTLKQSYVLIPLVAKVSIIPVINLQAGLQYGALASAAVNDVKEFDFGGGTTQVKDAFNSSDFSLIFGLGFDISKLMIDLRYNLGLSDINDLSLSNAEQLTNGTIQLSAGIKF